MTGVGGFGLPGRAASDRRDEREAPPVVASDSGVPPALEVQELEVPFGGEAGLKGISFRVEAGERFALVGASGVGKTSLLRAVAGSGPLAGGRILVEGREVTGLPQEGRGTVLLAQRPLLFPHLSVFENVAFPLRVRGVGREEVSRRVEEALALVRLEGFGPRRPQSLSGGQAHRVALTRAVVARPPVLLLDEPLTSLDPSLRDEVRRSILAVHAEYRPALVLVTHDLEEAGRMADQVGVLLDGSLAQVASPRTLFRQPASVAVARFLGLPNELPGRLGPDGSLVLAGWRVEEASLTKDGDGEPSSGVRAAGPGDPADREVTVVFGADAGRVLPAGAGGLPAQVLEVRHHPEGAVAQVALVPAATAAAAEGLRPRTGAAVAPEGPSPWRVAAVAGRVPPALPLACQVAADPHSPPEAGQEVDVAFIRSRMHLFDA